MKYTYLDAFYFLVEIVVTDNKYRKGFEFLPYITNLSELMISFFN